MTYHKPQVVLFFLLLGLLCGLDSPKAQSPGQNPNLRLYAGATEIALNEPLVITLEIRNEVLRSAPVFPDIPGLKKGELSSASKSEQINGRLTSAQTLSQVYEATREGRYPVKEIILTVNSKRVILPGFTLTVKAPSEETASTDDEELPAPYEEGDVDASPNLRNLNARQEAFFQVEADKEEVYVGEPFSVRLMVYIAESALEKYEFFEVGPQLNEILKTLKPASCWEEALPMDEIQQKNLDLGGRRYVQFKVYQSTLYPLNDKAIVLPSVGIKMVWFRSPNSKEETKVLNSSPVKVKVLSLPPHPLRDRVPVGAFSLKEEITRSRVKAGQAVEYHFILRGDGNLTALAGPQPQSRKDREIYPPNVLLQIERRGKQVAGKKEFIYQLVPRKSGSWPLAEEFFWIYFDPYRERYDTLKSRIRLRVLPSGTGQEVEAEAPEEQGLEVLVRRSGNRLISLNRNDTFRFWANVSVASVGLIGLLFAFFARRRRSPSGD